MLLTEDNDMIQAISADRTDEPLDRVCHRSQPSNESVALRAMAITSD
jgi:hypothetical protein